MIDDFDTIEECQIEEMKGTLLIRCRMPTHGVMCQYPSGRFIPTCPDHMATLLVDRAKAAPEIH